MDQILEKTIFRTYKGDIFEKEKKFTKLTENCSFCVVSVYAEQSYLPQ